MYSTRSQRNLKRYVSFQRLSLIIPLGIVGAGCVTGKQTNVVAPTQADRLIQAYPEIQNGRLLIVADFEDEKQMGIIQLEAAASTPGSLVRDLKSGRSETGAAALAVSFSGANESVLISNSRESEWSLQRDWRPYDLLMMAVNSPVAGPALEIKIVGGVSGQAVEARTETALVVGWNLLRFDLAEIGESVPLDDIQEIRLSLASPPSDPVTLHFDDILLAGNRRDLMGDSTNTSGSLYVQSAGRHWNVGAGGRFEISFRNGQITRWFNLAADPYRLRNLVRGTTLGPIPVRLEDESLAWTASADQAISARQRILEMNEVRVVIETLLEPQAGGNASTAGISGRWLYTIYPTGQIFVIAETTAAQGNAANSMAINLAWSSSPPAMEFGGYKTRTTPASEEPLFDFAMARILDVDAALLFIPYGGPAPLKMIANPTAKMSSIGWPGNAAPGQATTWRCQLVVTSTGELNNQIASARARDYLETGSVRVEVGQPKSAAMLREDGFDPGTGAYYVDTDGNRARIVIEGKKRPAFAPVFQIDGGSQDQAWVYVNYLLHPSVIRGQRGEAIFQVPGTITKEIVVEPLFKQSPAHRP